MLNNNKTLAQLIIQKRQKLGLSQVELAIKSGLELSQIIAIEDGTDLFLPTTVRQKLAFALKIDNKEIKKLEKRVDLNLAGKSKMNEIREQILLNNKEILCPNCGEKLITRVAKLYDLEDNLVLRPKARCPKCPFQLVD